MRMWFVWLIASVCLAPAFAHSEESGTGPEVTLLASGNMVRGELVLPANEKEFRLRSEGALLTIRWSQLDERERQRIQKLCGLLPGSPASGINAGAEALAAYQKYLAENPPGTNDPKAHLELARKAADLGLHAIALKHLDAAEAIDPRAAERNTAFRRQLNEEIHAKQASDLYQQVLLEQRAGNSLAALDRLDRLARNFPDSDLRSRWETLRPDLEAAVKRDLARQVVFMSYRTLDELLQHQVNSKLRTDERGNAVPAVPGKQVTTAHGKVFRGTFEEDDSGDGIILHMDHTALKLKKSDIALMQDIDLSVAAREADRTFDDLKRYVSDTGGANSLKGRMIARLAGLLKVPELEIRTIFDNRLERKAQYTGGNIEQTPVYASVHQASYGAGSWVREGTRLLPQPAAASSAASRRSGSTSAEDPDTSDDPNVWWKKQKPELRLEIMRAIAAEKIFSVKAVEKSHCKECGGRGTQKVHDASGVLVEVRCTVCRGSKYAVKIVYE